MNREKLLATVERWVELEKHAQDPEFYMTAEEKRELKLLSLELFRVVLFD